MGKVIYYTIINIDDTRNDRISDIRSKINCIPELSPHSIRFFDGAKEEDIKYYKESFSEYPWRWQSPKAGEAGIWISTLSVWRFLEQSTIDYLLVLESDAIVPDDFNQRFWTLFSEVPEDFDFFSLCVPLNQHSDFRVAYEYDDFGTQSNHTFGTYDSVPFYDAGRENICRIYQGYNCTAMLYSRKGAARLLEQTRNKGIFSTSDCQIMQLTKSNPRIDGYTTKPKVPNLIDADYEIKSTIGQRAHLISMGD